MNSSRLLLLVGTLLIAVLVGMLTVYSPLPRALSAVHSKVIHGNTLATCDKCHAWGGQAKGCVSCHQEIGKQVEQGTGYHSYLMRGKEFECRGCHREHLGPNFALTNDKSWGSQVPAAFRHPHMEFDLTGKHQQLACDDCHVKNLKTPFTLPDFPKMVRKKTHLGLSQDCRTCHEDIHAAGATGNCKDCHGQESFNPPAYFDHSVYLPLEGGHDVLDCSRCHLLPSAQEEKRPFPFPFEKKRGSACKDCHPSPHMAAFGDACDSCHPGSDPRWSSALAGMTPEKHLATRFPLVTPHANVLCEQCHSRNLTFKERYRDPSAPNYARGADSCEGCHRDVHKGQFIERYPKCQNCHEKTRWLPTTFGVKEHELVYPLSGGHTAAPCIGCHKVDAALNTRRFGGTTQVCKECHDNPHGKQFLAEIDQNDCTNCHNALADTFTIRPFDHDRRTTYILKGGHTRAGCNDCHVQVQLTSANAAAGSLASYMRRYRETPRTCASCHKDVHRGQFSEYGVDQCSKCHTSPTSWKEISFDHDTQSRFPLTGAHLRVPCAGCHRPFRVEDDSRVIQYKPLGRDCRNCHEIPPKFSPRTLR